MPVLLQETDERGLKISLVAGAWQVRRGAVEERLAICEHDHAVGVAPGFSNVVGCHQQCCPAGGAPLQKRPQALALTRVERSRRFVEQHKRGLTEQADGDVDALPQSAGQALDQIPGALTQHGVVEHRVDCGIYVRNALQAREQAQVLPDRQATVDGELLRHPADACGRSLHLAAISRLSPREDLQQRRLARAVGPDDGHDLALRDLQPDPAQRLTLTETLAQAARTKHGPGGSMGRSAHRAQPTLRETRAVPDTSTTLLFIGDVVGSPGRRALLTLLPSLLETHDPTFVIVNGENAAGGLGITPQIADEMFEAGVDAITLGNHAYHRREIYTYLDDHDRIVRPANYMRANPGRGACVVEKNGVRLGVANLSGNVFMRAARPAFSEIESILDDFERRGCDHVLVDMHAEATSEKVAMGWHLDGRATAVVGTHTHVPTADGRVLPRGTAYISDVGMTGPRGGVLGVKKEMAIESLLTQMHVRFETSEDDPWLMGVVIRCTQRLRADSIEQILLPAPPQA